MRISLNFEHLFEAINDAYKPLIQNDDRYLILYGGAGSGKSHFIAQKILLRILAGIATKKKHKFLCLRKTNPAVRKSVFALFKFYIDLWNVGSLVTINKTDMTFEFYGGSEILCMGLDDPEKIKSIEGVTGAWLEEVTEFTREDIVQVDLRIRGLSDSYKQIMLSFNPISAESHIKADFFDKRIESCTILKTTYRDNRFLDADYRRVLESLKDKDATLHMIYAEGEWGVLKGLIYTNWETIESMPGSFDQERIGIDFGFNHPSAITHCGVKDDSLYIDELLYESGLTNTFLIEQAKEVYPKKEDGEPNLEIETYCDSAEPDRIEEFSQAGFFAMPCRKGKHSIKNGIDKVKTFKKIYVTDRSINVIKELKAYKWREDKDGNALDIPVDFMNHAMDSIRYAAGNMETAEPNIIFL